MADIEFETDGPLGLVILNRPEALNALTHDMLLMFEERLLHWRDEPSVRVVAVIGAGPKAFCAGGDVRALHAAGSENGAANFQYYADEYRLDALIRRYPKPYVAFMDGVTMGGGVGVSVHGARRVAGDATVFAMPECAIGLFPDVGGTWFLPRLQGEIGMWLGLTGARLGPADALAVGLCDLFVPSDREGEALDALAGADYGDDALAMVDAALTGFRADPGPATLGARRAAIDRCFGGDGVEAVLAALDAEGSDWAAQQAAAIRRASPTSLRVAFRQIRAGRDLGFEDCMRVEYRLARFFMTHPDFYEGVRAALIDRDGAPSWRPPTLAQTPAASVEAAFAPLADGEELALG